MPEEPRQARSEFFAQILVDESILTIDDLRDLVSLQQADPPESRRPIGRLAVERGFLDERRFLAILDRHCHRLHLGELLVLRGMISLASLERAIREQKETGELLGDVLLRLHLIEQPALAATLAEQANVPFIPIHNIRVDRELARWVNPSFALKNGIVPIAVRGRSLSVAVWHPRSLSLASELERATGMRIHIVLTTRAEVETRLHDLYLAPDTDQAA